MKKSNKNKSKFWFSLIFLTISAIITSFAVKYIYIVYPNLQNSRDFLLDNLPFINLSLLSDLLILIGFALFIFFIFYKKRFKEVPFYFVIIGIFYLLRSALNYLTPLANPFPLAEYGLKIFPDGGMFPSGHTGILFLFYLFIQKKEFKHYKLAFLILTLAEIASLILSKGHYAIDIVGSLFITYGLVKIGTEKLKAKLILK